MMHFLIAFPAIIFAFLEATVFPLPIVLLFVLSLSVVLPGRGAFLTAFFAGLLIDLLTLRPLGFTSLFFLGLTALTFLYQRKFTASHFIFFLPAAVISISLYQLIFSKQIELWPFLVAVFFAVVIRFYVLQAVLRLHKPEQMSLEI